MTQANKHTIACNACRSRYQVAAEFSGRTIVCNKCGAKFTINLTAESNSKESHQTFPTASNTGENISQDDSYLTIGKLAVKYKMASVEQIKEALEIKIRQQKAGRKIFLGDVLVENKIITPTQLDFLHSVQNLLEIRKTDTLFGLFAVKNNFATQNDIDQALKKQQEIFKQTQTTRLIGDILIEAGVLSSEQRDAILIRQKHFKEVKAKKHCKPITSDPPATLDSVQNIFVSVGKEKLEAFISVKPEALDEISIENIKSMLAQKGIRHGLIEDAHLIECLQNKSNFQAPFKIAEGKAAQSGAAPRLKYYFERDPLKVGEIKAGGDIDFKDRGTIPQVKKGDLLAEKIAGCEGISGMDVYGEVIPPPKPIDILLRSGKGAAVSEDGFKVFALTDGVPKVSIHGKIYVLPQLEIDGDVCLKTGHVDFDGKILVSGCVQNGFRVKGQSLITKEVFKADVEVANDIIVSGGVIGAAVRTGGNIRSIYVHESNIKAFGDVIIDKEIIDSNIETSGACIIKSGTILSSRITAQKGIWAGQIGSDVSKPCSLLVGVDLPVKNELERTLAAISEKRDHWEKLKNQKEELDKRSDKIESEIGALAQIQDRAMIDLRHQQAKMSEYKKANNTTKMEYIQALLDQMNSDIKKRENELEVLFNMQDQNSDELSEIKKKIDDAQKKIDELEEIKTDIAEFSENGSGVPEVKVNDVIFPDTQISGIYASMILPKSFKSVMIKESGIKGPGETQKWDFKVSNL